MSWMSIFEGVVVVVDVRVDVALTTTNDVIPKRHTILYTMSANASRERISFIWMPTRDRLAIISIVSK